LDVEIMRLTSPLEVSRIALHVGKQGRIAESQAWPMFTHLAMRNNKGSGNSTLLLPCFIAAITKGNTEMITTDKSVQNQKVFVTLNGVLALQAEIQRLRREYSANNRYVEGMTRAVEILGLPIRTV
jgi:hypothetical protein